MEDKALRYFTTTPGQLLDVSFGIVDQHGIAAAMSSREISSYKNIDIYIQDQAKSSQYFKDGGKILLSVIEAVSMAYVAIYYQQTSSDKSLKYSIGVDIQDRHKRLTEREYFLSDGVLSVSGGTQDDRLTPFQQVTAQNILGKSNQKLDIEAEIIKQINRKISRRRSYNDISGLIISACTNGGSIDISKIVDQCDLEAFQPTFLIVYKDDFKSATVFYLDNNIKNIDELRNRAYDIKPQLKPAS